MGYNKNHQNLNSAFNCKHLEGNVEGETYGKNNRVIDRIIQLLEIT